MWKIHLRWITLACYFMFKILWDPVYARRHVYDMKIRRFKTFQPTLVLTHPSVIPSTPSTWTATHPSPFPFRPELCNLVVVTYYICIHVEPNLYDCIIELNPISLNSQNSISLPQGLLLLLYMSIINWCPLCLLCWFVYIQFQAYKILNIGTDNRSWWYNNGFGCRNSSRTSYEALPSPASSSWLSTTSASSPVPLDQVLPSGGADGCLLQYYYIEVIHAGLQCLLAVRQHFTIYI